MQLSLLADVERRARAPWKRVRPTSVARYAVLRDSGRLATRRASVLRAVAAIRNATQQWPTACEVQVWLEVAGDIPKDGNPNHVRPRLTELADGWFVKRTMTVDGRRVVERVHVPCDVLVRGPKRKSHTSGISVITWCVREVGGRG